MGELDGRPPRVDNRIKRISDKTAKAYVLYLQVLFILCFVVLTVQAVWVQLDFSVPHAREKVLGMNIACGSVSLLLLMTFAMISWRDWRRNETLVPDLERTGDGRRVHVPPRPARYFALAIIDYAALVAVTAIFFSVDIFLLTDECGWLYSWSEVVSFFKWALFIGIVSNQFCHILSMLPKEAIIKTVKLTRIGWYFKRRGIEITDGVELPWSVFAAVFATFYAVPFLCILIGLLASVGVFSGSTFCSSRSGPDCLEGLLDSMITESICNPWSSACEQALESNKDLISKGRDAALTIACSVIMFYIVLYIVCLILLARALHPMAYKRFKIIHMHLGYHIMTRIPLSLLLLLNFLFLWLVQIGTCPVQFLTSTGFGSMILALSGMSAAGVWFTTPVAYGTDHEEGEIAFDDRKNDNPAMKISYARMLESFVFSYMVYEVDELKPHEQMFELHEFMEFYGLEDYDVLWNKHVDSKCLMAWNSSTGKIVISFRGTASGRNVVSDLKIWREPHEPERGNYWLGTKPMVHSGFCEFFYRSGMREDCLERLEAIVQDRQDHEKTWNILMVGHSLGGAAAKIAAYDISDWLNAKAVSYRLSCYTYGCPRVGNSAFATAYEQMVPDTWTIMHLDDLVTKGGKFIYMFKRGGRRCFLTNGGPIVQPSYMTRVTLRGLRSSVQRHMLPSYARSLVYTVTQHSILDWNNPEKQRIRLSIMNSKVFKHLQKNFTERIDIDLARKRHIDLEALHVDDDIDGQRGNIGGMNDLRDTDDIDLATGMVGIHRRDSTTVGHETTPASASSNLEPHPRRRWHTRLRTNIFSWFGHV